jgi:pyrimidine-nucleoside phosphorylase
MKAGASGYVKRFDTELIGRAALVLGAGRARLEDKIDPMAGIIVNKKIGQVVEKSETLFELYGFNKVKIEEAREMLKSSFEITNEKIASPGKIVSLMEK